MEGCVLELPQDRGTFAASCKDWIFPSGEDPPTPVAELNSAYLDGSRYQRAPLPQKKEEPMNMLSPASLLPLALLLIPSAAGSSTPPYWEAVEQHGEVPPPLWEAGASFARSVSDPKVVYRFGGQVGEFPNDPTLNDFYAFDVATATWANLASDEAPAPRADALLIPGPCGGCVSIVGGRGRFRTGLDFMFPEMWTYHVHSGHWKAVKPEKLGDPFAVRRSSAPVIEVPSPAPPHKPTYYAFGGVGNTLPKFPTTPGGLRNDVVVYEKNSGWSPVLTFGDEPVPRGWSAGAYDPASHSLLIFGGYRLGPDQGPETPPFELFGPTNYTNDLWSLDLDTLQWTELEPEGPLPSPRDNARGFFDTSRGGLVLFGGQAFDGPLNDLWFYSLAENRWMEVTLAPGSPVPSARVGAVHFVHETATAFELYLHSGATSDGGPSLFLNDLWKLTWPKG